MCASYLEGHQNDVFEEISSALASITAACCALAVGSLVPRATCRGAYQAYLQARCDSETGHITLMELPREWWPVSWFDSIKVSSTCCCHEVCCSWSSKIWFPVGGENDWNSRLGPTSNAAHRWFHPHSLPLESVHLKELATAADFSEVTPILMRYLGAMHRLDAFDATLPSRPRT